MAVQLNGKAIKAGARHSATDQQMIQSAHDQLVAAGAVCGGIKIATFMQTPYAIKARADGKIEGYLVRYSSPSRTDLEWDYFDRQTDLGVRDGATLPVLWHHNLDEAKRGIIGKGVASYTDAGLWFQSWLNIRDEYDRYILKMIEMDKAGYSGGASSIVRRPTAGKARYVARFPLVEGSITPTPMEPGNAVSLKALTNTRKARIERELALLEEDLLLDIELELDDLEWQIRLEKELDALERR